MNFKLFSFFFLPFLLLGQGPTLSVNSASISIDPANSDSYTLQGSFSGLTFHGAVSVTLQVGPFSATIPMSSFVEQPSNVFIYQDTTSQTSYWISGLTIDGNAGTFSGQATGVVLDGIGNPFAVQLGTDQAFGCSMVRVQASDEGAYQLSPGDGVNEPCLISEAVAEPPAVFAGATANVTFTITMQSTPGLDPSSLQVYRADGDGQPSGGSLCTLSDNGDGTFSCVAAFNESNPGMIPLVVQANAGSQTILSPGFVVQAVVPASDADKQQIADIQAAMTQAFQNFDQYGDGAYARILTMQALRTALQAPAGLVGQPEELCADGLSIGVRSNSGLPIVMVLNDLYDATANSVTGSQRASSALTPRVQVRMKVSKPKVTAAPTLPLQCGQFKRDIVWNDHILIWDPGQIFFRNDYIPDIATDFQSIKCPAIDVRLTLGRYADLQSLSSFGNFGTVIVSSHGTVDHNHRGLLLTAEQVTSTDYPVFSPTAAEGIACTEYQDRGTSLQGGCFRTAYASYLSANMGLASNTIVMGDFCFSGHRDIQQAFVPTPQNTYFGYAGRSDNIDGPIITESILDGLLSEHAGTLDSFLAAPAPMAYSALLPFGDPNLAYLGNPVLYSPQQSANASYVLGPGDSLDLQARLDGANGCGGVMNYNWVNTGNYGNLTPADIFTSGVADTTYQARPNSQGVDNIFVDFYPDLSAPPAARACIGADVSTQQVMHIVFDGQGTGKAMSNSNSYSYSASWQWHAAWDVIVQETNSFYGVGLAGGSYFEPALPGTTVTGTETVNAPASNFTCTGPPVLNPTHDGVTTPLPQSPFIGIGPNMGPPGTPLIPMWVETFGGDDFDLCGGGFPNLGDYGPTDPGYPGWDQPSGIAKFTLDASQWANQPDHTSTIPVQGDFYTIPGGYDTGEVHFNGVLTLTTTTPKSSAMVRRAPVNTAAKSSRP